MAITPSHIKKLHLLLNRAGINTPEDKAMLALQYSQGRTDRTSLLNDREYIALLNHLDKTYGDVDPGTVMRRKIISRAHEMSWEMEDGSADLDRIDNWCSKYGYLHKPLNSYTAKELPRLLTQFEKVYFDFLNKV